MTLSRRNLSFLYAFIGAVALVVCWRNNLQLFGDAGIVEANVRFWQATFVNPASRSITVDILCLGLGAIVWMLLEARRLGMRGAWAWVLFGVFVAMGAAFPWFLIHREWVLAKHDGASSAGTLSTMDLVGIVLVGLPTLGYALVAFSR